MTLKMVSDGVCYLFYRPMDEKIKTCTWSIVSQYVVKAKYRLISRKFLGMKFFSSELSLNQPKATRVCIRSTHQSNRSLFRSFVVSGLFARFHFKVIRKSL